MGKFDLNLKDGEVVIISLQREPFLTFPRVYADKIRASSDKDFELPLCCKMWGPPVPYNPKKHSQ